MMELADFFEWLQEAVEKRWGKAWAWGVYFASLAAFLTICWLTIYFARR